MCRRALPVVAAILLGSSAGLAQQPPTSLLPAFLGQQQAAPAPQQDQPPPAPPGQAGMPANANNALFNQLAAPPAQPGQALPGPLPAEVDQGQSFPVPQQQAQPLVSPPAGTLGTVPAGNLGTIPQSALDTVSGAGLGEVLSQIDGPLPSAGAQRAVREVLLDRALAQTTDPIARAGALYAIGFAEDAAGAAIEAETVDVAGRALTARALLAVGQSEQACRHAEVEEIPQDAAPGPTFELLEILALCKIEQGTPDAASLIAGLIKEQGGGDPLFFAGIDAATGGEARFPAVDQVSRVRPIHQALLARAGIALPAEFVARADLALVSAIARDERLDQAARITATERAVAAGLADENTLVGLYGQTPLAEDLLMQAATGTAPDGPLPRAHIFALIAEAPGIGERLRLIEAMYGQGRAGGVGAAVAAALGEDVAGITPEPALGAAAPLVTEILTRADRARAALGWVDAGEFPGPGGQPALDRFAAHRVRALIALLAPEAGLGVAAGALGADAGGGALAPGERAFITSEVTYMTALGDFVSPVLAEIAGRPPAPQAGAGPVALVSGLAALAGTAPGEASDQDIAAGIAALAASGFEVEARRLAVEALIARGGGG